MLLRKSSWRQCTLIGVRYLRRFTAVPDEPKFKEGAATPYYAKANIRLRGYDFAVLEAYQRFAHKIVNRLGIQCSDGWAVPPLVQQVDTYKPRSSTVEASTELRTYERNLQVTNLTATKANLLLDVLRSELPQGVRMTLKKPDAGDQEARYIPNTELKLLRKELEEVEKRLEKDKY